MLFLRVIVWCGAEKFSLKKSCFYLYIRRNNVCHWTTSTACQRWVQLLNDQKNFGIHSEEEVAYIGGNAKMNEFQAAMGICNMRHLDEEIKKREIIVNRYRERLGKS